jgi:hypothetical protein
MSDYRPTKYEDLAKQLFRLGVHKAGGPKAVQEWTGLDTSEISRLSNDSVDRHAHFSRIIEIDEAANHEILKAWARRAGLEVIEADREGVAGETVSKASVATLEASTGFITSTLEASADGAATNNEIRDAETKKNTLIGAIERAFDALTALRKS